MAPNCLASASFSGTVSTAMMVLAPWTFRAWMQFTPTPPTPITATCSGTCSPTCRQASIAYDRDAYAQASELCADALHRLPPDGGEGVRSRALRVLADIAVREQQVTLAQQYTTQAQMVNATVNDQTEHAAILFAQAKLAQSLGTTVASIQTLERAGELAGSGFTVVSGMAVGVDRASHEGALSAGRATVGTTDVEKWRALDPTSPHTYDARARIKQWTG